MTQTTYTPTLMEKLLGRNYKWWFLILHSFKSASTYSFQNIFYILSAIFRSGLFILVWYVNYLSGSNILSLQEIIHYFVLGEMVNGFLHNEYPAFAISNKIKEGELVEMLLKPTDALSWFFFKDLGASLFPMITQIVLTALLMLGLNFYFPFNFNFFDIIFFLALILIIRFMQFLFHILKGMSSFWFVEIWGVNTFFSTFERLADGTLIPLQVLIRFFPVFNFLLFLPFAYFFYHPILVLMGSYGLEQKLTILSIAIFWTAIFYFLAKLVFKMGLKRNESVGL